MMMAGDITTAPNHHLVWINQPDMKEAPTMTAVDQAVSRRQGTAPPYGRMAPTYRVPKMSAR